MDQQRTRKPMSPQDAALMRNFFASGMINVPGRGVRMKNATTLKHGQALRDEWLWQFPILPGAVMTYIQAAVSREWTVTGTPRRAARAVETLNETRYMDATGEIHFGWQALQTRRVMDWLCLGKTAMVYPRTRGGGRGYLQYADPTEFILTGDMPSHADRILSKRTKPPMTNTVYLNRRWRSDELLVNYAVAAGGAGMFGSPLLGILPSARLAYLIREHDQARADGRKIRDIFIVADEDMRDSLWDAIITNLKLWNGGSVTEHGVPIVAATTAGGLADNIDVSKLFARLGLADIPDDLNRSEFWLDYANEIAALLGLSLRTFWSPQGQSSNRAVEKVAQERARRVGPSYYILSEERHLNYSGILGDRVRFQFIEEADTQLLKDRAAIAYQYAQAVEKLKASIPELSGRALMNWLQQLMVLPNDEDLLAEISTLSESPVQVEDMIDGDVETMIAEEAEANREAEIEAGIEAQEAQFELQERHAIPTPAQDQEEAKTHFREEIGAIARYMRSVRQMSVPDYGEVVLGRDGKILESRARTYHVGGLLALEKSMETDYDYIDADTYEDQVEDLISDAFGD